jgi:hypothetical protein
MRTANWAKNLDQEWCTIIYEVLGIKLLDLVKITVYNIHLQSGEQIMSVRIESRNGQIDTELCVKNAGGGRYDLVIAAAQRLREMKRRARETNEYVTPIDALLEAQAGQLNMIDYMAKVK